MAGLPTDLQVADVLGSTEDLLLAKITELVGAYVKSVATLPGVWDDEMLSRLLRMVPGVFLAFQRASKNPSSTTTVDFTSTWSVIVAVSNAGGEGLRRRGDSTGVGAYNLVCALATGLDGQDMGDAGSVTVGDITDLFSGSIDKRGLVVYALDLTVPLVLDKTDTGALDVFATFDARLDMPQHTPGSYPDWLANNYANPPDAHDLVLVPQDRLIVSAVFDQAHYLPAMKLGTGVSLNARGGAELVDTAPYMNTLGSPSTVFTIELDWYKKWGNDGKGNPALTETVDENGMPVYTQPTPSDFMRAAELAHQGRTVVVQLVGAAAQFQEDTYGSVARHRTAKDVPASGAMLVSWMAPDKHTPGAYVVWQENEAMRTTTGVEKGYNVAGEPEFIGEKNSEYQDRKKAARSKAATDLAQIWATAQRDMVLRPFTPRGMASFVYGDFNANKTTDPEDDGGTDSNGKLGFVAAMDALDDVRALDGAVPPLDEVSLNSFNGKWEAQLQGVRERLGSARVPLVLNQIAPAVRKLGPSGDKSSSATVVQIAVAMLSDMAAMLKHTDLRAAHWAYWTGGDQAVLTALTSGGYKQNTTWHALEWMATRMPSRRVVLNGLQDAGAGASVPGVHGLAGVSSRRAAVLLWNDSNEPGTMSLQLVGLPTTLTALSYTTTALVLVNGETAPRPLEVAEVGGFIDLAVPAWSAVLVELVAAGTDPLARRNSLAAGGHAALLVGTPMPHINATRPLDHARYDVARDVAYLGIGQAGAGSAAVAPAWADLPDTLYASLAAFHAPGAGSIDVHADYFNTAGDQLGSATLTSVSTDSLGAGTVQALGLAAAAPAGWAAAGRVARLQISFTHTVAGALAEVYLSGSLLQAQAPYV